MSRNDEVGTGPLARGTAGVYRVMVVGVLLVLLLLPTVVALAFIAPDKSNLPLYAVVLLPVGPALSAALFALRSGEASRDLSPSRPFWRGLRMNSRPVLTWWVPFLAVATVLGINLAHLDAVPGGAALGPFLVVLVVVAGLWSVHMLLITSFFTFRLRDAARIASWAMVAHWRVTLGIAACGVLAAVVIRIGTEAFLLLLAAPLTLLLHWAARSLITDVTERFTRHG